MTERKDLPSFDTPYQGRKVAGWYTVSKAHWQCIALGCQYETIDEDGTADIPPGSTVYITLVGGEIFCEACAIKRGFPPPGETS